MPWYHRWMNVFRPAPLDRALDAELQYHLEETVDRLVASGLPEPEARRQAQLRLGNYTLQKERTRDRNIAAWLDATRADLLYGLRQLRMSPGFTAVALLSLALGIGANSAIFQLIDAIRLKSLPVRHPEELAAVEFNPGSARAGWWTSRSANFTFRQWEQVRDQQRGFSGVFAWSAGRMDLTKGGEPRYAEGLFVSGSFFEVLGVRAALGRTLTVADETGGCNAGAVLSHAYWQRELAGDPAVLGRMISLSGLEVPVIGVTGPAFHGIEVGNRYDLAIPLCADALMAADRKGRAAPPAAWWLSIMGRLAPGWTVEAATAQLAAVSPQIMSATLPPDYNPALAKRYLANRLRASDASTGISGLRREYERPLWLLMAITGLVLVIACANLANLLLARAAVREREIAVRLALGASRVRLVRQLLAESLLLAIGGTAGGVVLAAVLSRSLIGLISGEANPVFVDFTPDLRMLLFNAALAVATCLLFGLLPALRATVLSPAAAMRAGGRSMTAGRERFTLRRMLVAGQVALSLVLLVGALLFVRTLHNLLTADAGFDTEGVTVVNFGLEKAGVRPERRAALYLDLRDRLAALPGVVAAAQVGSTPVSRSSWDQSIGPDGARATESGKTAYFNRAAPGYFAAIGTRLLAGRDFDRRDTLEAPPVAIVNEEFARRYYGGANPVGHSFHLEAGAGKPEERFEVVGMIANAKYHDLRQDFVPIAFLPIAQEREPGAEATFVLRLRGPDGPVRQGAKAMAAAVSPLAGVTVHAFSQQLAESVLRERLMATLSGAFGLLAGLLSMLGLYGVIDYMVARRNSELGVRMALGARPAHVIGLVLREALLLVAAGLGAGLLLVLWAGQAAATLLYGLAPHDAVTLSGAALLLTGVALLASYLPARRAAAIEPVAALRAE